MKNVKAIDKIGIPIFFLGILVIFYFMRTKDVQFIQFFSSFLCYLAYLGLAFLLNKRFSPHLKNWVAPLTSVGLCVWFEYITTARFHWWLFAIPLLLGFFIGRKRKRSEIAR
jgi:hypothetical protein